MHSSAYIRIIFLFFFVLLSLCHSRLNYTDLEAMGIPSLGIPCSRRWSCVGYTQNQSPMDRNCMCDYDCKFYGDCCIDAYSRQSLSTHEMRSDVNCLKYGEEKNTGVYVVDRCSSGWNGTDEVREKCEGDLDLSDPVFAAPVTSTQSVTYKNIYCAECNYAQMQSLKVFLIKLRCDDFEDISEEQALSGLFYDQQLASWGFNRTDAEGNQSFVQCDIIFYVPDYLSSSVRYCHANIISNCSSDWRRRFLAVKCKEYTAVVYSGLQDDAYRNPHCAICNYKLMTEVFCSRLLIDDRKRKPSYFSLLLDVNQRDGDRISMANVTITQCLSGYNYDPFFKRCRTFFCSLPGHEVVNGTCVHVVF